MFDSRYRGGTDRRQGRHPSPPWVELRVSSLREQVGSDTPCAYLCPQGRDNPPNQLEERAMREDWRDYAACQGMDPELWYPMKGDGATADRAVAVCAHCPVRGDCLADAIDGRALYGIWGGTTEDERRPMIVSAPPKPPEPQTGVTCPRCHTVRPRSAFIAASGLPSVRCSQCLDRQRTRHAQRRKEGAR